VFPVFPHQPINLHNKRCTQPFAEVDLPLPDPTPDVVLPTDDGTHYVHVIALPFTVWDSTHQTIAVYIDPQHPNYAIEVKQAFIAWQQALGHMFAFRFVTDPQRSDCAISWAKQLANHPQHPQEVYTAGLTESIHNNTFIFRNDITFTTLDPAQQTVSQVAMYNTAVHEIGHMLGIKGHSDQQGDVMAAISLGDDQRHPISHRDVNTLRVLYQPQTQAPRILTPPNISLAQFRLHQQWVDKAFDLDKQNRFPDAMAAIIQANSVYARNPEAHLLLANLHLRNRQYAQAKTVLQPWANQPALPTHQALYSKYVVAHVMQANAYAESNQASQARQEAQTTLPKLSRALQLPGLDANVRQYLLKVQPALQQLADLPA
jgi:predicted Zn-dependent protease